MTNKEWLDYLAQNAPDELAAWFDAEHVETEERALDGGAEPENEDSRELLEAEIESYSAFDIMDTITLDMVIGWIDRQVAITSNAMSGKINDLTARRDELIESLSQSHRDWLDDVGEYEEIIDKLKAERDNLEANNQQLHTLAGEQATTIDVLQIQVDELTAEREHYRELFGKCLDYADAIHALMDEGMA